MAASILLLMLTVFIHANTVLGASHRAECRLITLGIVPLVTTDAPRGQIQHLLDIVESSVVLLKPFSCPGDVILVPTNEPLCFRPVRGTVEEPTLQDALSAEELDDILADIDRRLSGVGECAKQDLRKVIMHIEEIILELQETPGPGRRKGAESDNVILFLSLGLNPPSALELPKSVDHVLSLNVARNPNVPWEELRVDYRGKHGRALEKFPVYGVLPSIAEDLLSARLEPYGATLPRSNQEVPVFHDEKMMALDSDKDLIIVFRNSLQVKIDKEKTERNSPAIESIPLEVEGPFTAVHRLVPSNDVIREEKGVIHFQPPDSLLILGRMTMARGTGEESRVPLWLLILIAISGICGFLILLYLVWTAYDRMWWEKYVMPPMRRLLGQQS